MRYWKPKRTFREKPGSLDFRTNRMSSILWKKFVRREVINIDANNVWYKRFTFFNSFSQPTFFANVGIYLAEPQIGSFLFCDRRTVCRNERKFPEKQKVIDHFLTDLSYEYVYTPHQMKSGLFEIRDPNDYPVLYIAVIENIDILITGDKDFTSLIIEKPQILTPSDFISKYMWVSLIKASRWKYSYILPRIFP